MVIATRQVIGYGTAASICCEIYYKLYLLWNKV